MISCPTELYSTIHPPIILNVLEPVLLSEDERFPVITGNVGLVLGQIKDKWLQSKHSCKRNWQLNIVLFEMWSIRDMSAFEQWVYWFAILTKTQTGQTRMYCSHIYLYIALSLFTCMPWCYYHSYVYAKLSKLLAILCQSGPISGPDVTIRAQKGAWLLSHE